MFHGLIFVVCDIVLGFLCGCDRGCADFLFNQPCCLWGGGVGSGAKGTQSTGPPSSSSSSTPLVLFFFLVVVVVVVVLWLLLLFLI